MGVLEDIAVRLDSIENRLDQPIVRESMRWLRVPEAAQYIGVSKETIRRWAHAGKIPFVQMSPAAIGFDVRDLDSFMESKKSTA